MVGKVGVDREVKEIMKTTMEQSLWAEEKSSPV